MTRPGYAIPIGSPSPQQEGPAETPAPAHAAPEPPPQPAPQEPPAHETDADSTPEQTDQPVPPPVDQVGSETPVEEQAAASQSWEPRQQKAKEPKPPKESKAPKAKLPKAQIPQGVRPPTYFFSLATWHWWLNQLFHKRDKDHPTWLSVPAPGKREQAERDRQAALRAEYERQMNFKLDLVMAVTRIRALLIVPGLVLDFYVANQRGQSHKTVISFLIGNVLTWIGRVNAILWTATLNTTIGAAAAMSGLPPELLENSRLTTLVSNREKYHTPQDVFNGPDKLGRTETGLVVVVEDRHGNVGKPRQLSQGISAHRYAETFGVIRPLVPGPSVSDGGNDRYGRFILELANGASVHVYVGDSNSRGSLDNMYGAINGVRSAPKDFGKPTDLPEGTSFVSLQEKAANAVIVASNWNSTEPFDFEPWLEVDPHLTYEVEPKPFQGVKLTTPHEPSLVSQGPRMPVSLNWFSLSREMQLAGMNIVIAGARMAARMQNIPIGFVDLLQPDFDAASYLLNMDVSDVKSWYTPDKLDAYNQSQQLPQETPVLTEASDNPAPVEATNSSIQTEGVQQ